MRTAIIALTLIATPVMADEYDNYNDNSNAYEQDTRPLGGYYNQYSPGYGSGWQQYSNGHSCYTSTVNGYSTTTCN